MTTSLEGEVALVTGAGKRIGRAIALELARAGADIIIHVNKSAAEGEEAAESVRSLGRRAEVVRADQRKVDDIRLACRESTKELSPISILVNSAAVWPKVNPEEIREADFNFAMEVNLRGPFFWAQCLGYTMKKNGNGVIVNITDAACGRPQTDSIPYFMAKAAVNEMTCGLARALGPEVRVNAVAPGPVLFPENYTDEQKEADRRATLMKREGAPEDVARAVRFLCENDYITGTVLPVDGGFRFGI